MTPAELLKPGAMVDVWTRDSGVLAGEVLSFGPIMEGAAEKALLIAEGKHGTPHIIPWHSINYIKASS